MMDLPDPIDSDTPLGLDASDASVESEEFQDLWLGVLAALNEAHDSDLPLGASFEVTTQNLTYAAVRHDETYTLSDLSRALDDEDELERLWDALPSDMDDEYTEMVFEHVRSHISDLFAAAVAGDTVEF